MTGNQSEVRDLEIQRFISFSYGKPKEMVKKVKKENHSIVVFIYLFFLKGGDIIELLFGKQAAILQNDKCRSIET